MKNVILILISVLMLVCGVLLLISSNDDYAAERLFYHAAKANREIAINPDVAPPKMLKRVEDGLQRIVKTYPGAKATKPAHLMLAEFYVMNERYEQAHSTLDEIISKYSQDKLISSRAYFLKGSAYEKQDLWDKALQQYTTLRDKYSDTELGLSIPLYIGNYYEGKGDAAGADEAYRQAALFYTKLETENRGQALGYVSANLSVSAYIRLDEYEQAGRLLEDMVDNYPQLLPLAQQFSRIDLIFLKKLNKSEKAIEIYRKIRKKTDNNELIGFINDKIEALEAQK